ncbi:hypothetical protein FOZ62_030124, partial [Perkinsus olseni]
MPRRSKFISLLGEIASEENLAMSRLSMDWILQFKTKSPPFRQTSVFGYTFDVNTAAAVEICKEKSATSIVLADHGVPNVPHTVFLNPCCSVAKDYIPKTQSAVEQVLEYWKKEGSKSLVLKPLKGTGGNDVMVAHNVREVEAGVMAIFSREYGLAVSPFLDIINEYRVVCTHRKPQLMYSKKRMSLVGDGVSTITELCAGKLTKQSAKGIADLLGAIENPRWVPREGEVIPLQWKHNLGLGAKAKIVDKDTE